VVKLWAGWSGFDSQQGQENFYFSKVSRLALRPTQLPTQSVLLQGTAAKRCEADPSPATDGKIKIDWHYTPTTPICLAYGKDRDNFTFSLPVTLLYILPQFLIAAFLITKWYATQCKYLNAVTFLYLYLLKTRVHCLFKDREYFRKYSILLSTLLSHTLTLCSSPHENCFTSIQSDR
jgi:hypothetical protein